MVPTVPDIPSIFLGVRRPPGDFTPCAVVTDTRPGWLSVLPSFGFHCCTLFVPDPSAPWLPTLLHSHSDCQVFRFAATVSIPALPYIFGQGSLAVATLLQHQMLSHWVFSLDLSDALLPPPPSVGLTLFHPDYGGVVSGLWSFWSPKELSYPASHLVEGRTLTHVLDKATKVSTFKPCAPPAWSQSGSPLMQVSWVDASESVLEGRGFLPVNKVFCAIQCPLVYSTTRWAIRNLTVKELLKTLDHPAQQVQEGRVRQGSLMETSDSLEEAPAWPRVPGTEWKGISDSTTKADDMQAHTALWDHRVLARVPVDRH